jgi:hypothetical protein
METVLIPSPNCSADVKSIRNSEIPNPSSLLPSHPWRGNVADSVEAAEELSFVGQKKEVVAKSESRLWRSGAVFILFFSGDSDDVMNPPGFTRSISQYRRKSALSKTCNFPSPMHVLFPQSPFEYGPVSLLFLGTS